MIDSRLGREGDVIRRRRRCGRCGRRFTTHERADVMLPMVVKKDGRRETFDRTKIVNGVRRACEKRPVPMDTIEALADRIGRQLQERGEREVRSEEVGEAVMRDLHTLDAVAYIRFASVYRAFGDVDAFRGVLQELVAERPAGDRPGRLRARRRGRSRGRQPSA